MRKIVHMLQWKVGDKVFVIHTMKRFGLDSDVEGVCSKLPEDQWVNDGFDVYYNGEKKNFIKYPIDQELLDFAKTIDKE